EIFLLFSNCSILNFVEMIFLRLILKNNVSVERVETLAWERDWYLHDFIPPTDEEVYEQIWLTQDENTSIHYVEDPLIGIRYLFIDGLNQVEICDKISSSLDIFRREEIFNMVHTAVSAEEYVRAIYHVGIIANHDYNMEIFEIFKLAFAHPETKVRNAAILATAYVGWREFEELLRDIIDCDPEEKVRDFANFTLKSLQSKNWEPNLNDSPRLVIV
ncbi:MAG: hypothetical protein F6K47_40875, partial [Symploca sp. SIO2E6]|nr:hypothetical protein [Symploca sp. SIO2E6]